MSRATTRRRFLAGTAAAIATPFVIPSSALGRGAEPAPSGRIGLGAIGLGARNGSGRLAVGGAAQVTAVCDVVREKREATQRRIGNGCKAYNDFRDVIADPNVDALTIATPEKVVDPTGAGDSFAGGMMGYIAEKNIVDTATLHRAIAYGTIVASIELEDFSLNRFAEIDRGDIDARFAEFKELTAF